MALRPTLEAIAIRLSAGQALNEMRKSPARDSYQALSSTAFDIGETRQCTAEPYFPPYARVDVH
jgi:hypothetical protein